MPRTKLFRYVQHMLSTSPSPATAALSRRKLIQLSAASLAAAGIATHPLGRMALASNPSPTIAIIGGGTAGLTTAYRLAQAGYRPMLFEASKRFGGRMYTKDQFNQENMFCELGGELVDTVHEDLMALCKELGVGIQKLESGEAGEDLYYFGGTFRSLKDMLSQGKGAFLPLAQKIAAEQEQLLDADDNWTELAKRLDNMTLKAYLDSCKGLVEPWVIDLLDVAYTGEYGLETTEQSALNLVDFIGVDVGDDFKIFGDSDEAYRIQGGSSRLPEALQKALEHKAALHTEHSLEAITYDGKTFSLTLATPEKTIPQTADYLICALPFTRLREVKGIDTLGLSQEKLTAIQTLGYGTNAKILLGTKERVWHTKPEGFPAPSNGSFFSDLSFQNIWETSRAQTGNAGILTNFLGGKAGEGNAEEQLTKTTQELTQMMPALDGQFDGNHTHYYWARQRFTKGSYSCPKPGQYTTLLEVTATPELGGTLLFAGEHTSLNFCGFMNGAVQSGNQAAHSLVEILQKKKAA